MYLLSTLMLALASLVHGSPIAPKSLGALIGCSENSLKGFQWQVMDFDFHASYTFTTPAHQNSWGYASFNLSNAAVPDIVASCSAQSDQLQDFFYGTPSYQCTVAGTPGPAPASFTFNRPTGELKINQTWTCNDQNPKYPTRFSASGSTNLTLACNTTTWQNPNWQNGEIWSDTEVKCGLTTVELKPFLMTAVA
ncbi:unnamed protein product [Discula destructiva]